AAPSPARLVSNRREFLRTLGAGAALASPLGPLACRPAAQVNTAPQSAGWELVPGILSSIVAPKLRDAALDITRCGARADASFDKPDAIHRAIPACSAAGGGRVVVP